MSVAFALLSALLLVATLGEGGSVPDVLLAVHLLALLAAAAAWLGAGGGAFRAGGPLRIALAAFAALALAGAAAAPYAYAALLTLVEVAVVALVAFAACRSGPALPGRLAPILAVAILVHAVVAAVQRVGGWQTRPASTFLNPNHLAAWTVAAGFVVAGRLAAGRRDRFFPLGAAALVAGAAAFVLLGSRGAALGALAGAAVCSALVWPALAPKARRAALAATLAAAALGAAGVAWRFRTAADPFAFQRVDIWRASLSAGLEHPWLGLGPGQFKHESRRFNFPLEDGTLRFARHFASTDSDAIRVAVEFGLPAALVALVGAGLVAATVVRRRREGSLDPASAGACAAIAALFAQSLVDNLASRPAVALLAAALVGSVVAVPSDTVCAPARRTRWGVVLAVLLVWGAADLAPWLSWRARSDPARALAWNPHDPQLHLRAAEALAARAPAWSAQDFARAAEAAQEAVRLSPRDPRYLGALAGIEATACRTLFPFAAYRDRVGARYAAALALSPHDPAIALEASLFLQASGDAAGAIRFARAAVAIEPRAAVPRLALAEALEASGDRTGAASELERAVALERAGAAVAGTSGYHARLLRLPSGRVTRLLRLLSDPMGLAPGLEHQDVPQVVVPVPPAG
ncbi:MAG TPA: O-antigen ligase family protein [Candidatus Polarisedimenticolaceae bacterium]